MPYNLGSGQQLPKTSVMISQNDMLKQGHPSVMNTQAKAVLPQQLVASSKNTLLYPQHPGIGGTFS